MRFFLVPACVVTAICTGMAAAQSPVAYVYVGESAVQTQYSPVYAYSASSDGKLTPIKGSPFTQAENTGIMIGANGSHFIFSGQGPDVSGQVPFNFLYSYNVGSNGALGQQVSVINAASYSGAGCSVAGEAAELDHTGQYIYVPACGNALQTYKISKSGGLAFQNVTTDSDANAQGGAPKISGNNAFAYNLRLLPSSNEDGLSLLARESDGSLDYRGGADVAGPSLPENYSASFTSYNGNGEFNAGPQYPVTGISNDPANHFAAALILEKFIPPDTTANEGCALASFAVGSHGELASTNTYDKMPKLIACGSGMLLSPSGKTLAVNGGSTLEFFHFNASAPITPLGEIVSKSGGFTTMAWDNSDHLYALNGLSGRLHVYTVSSSKVVEAPGSPYDIPFCGYDQQDSTSECPQTLIVRIIPK